MRDGSSSEDELVDDVELTEEQVKVLETVSASSADPYNYELHVQAIQALSTAPIFAAHLEEQFARFHEAFPLTLDLWTQYVALAPHMLVEALKDYLQPSLYYQYIDTLEGEADADEQWSAVLSALGCHWRECEKIYGLYRSFLRDTITDQMQLFERLKLSYESQLAVPLFDGHERVLSEYRAWSEYQPSSQATQKSLHAITTTIKRTKNIYRDMAAFEAQLDMAASAAQPEVELQNVWLKYIAYVKGKIKVVGVSIIMTVLERAVAQVCLSSALWQVFLDFLLEQRMYNKMIATGMRAVRNVPFVASVWVSLLVALEANGGFESYEVILDDLEGRKSLSLDQLLVVLLAYCDTIRRQIPTELASAFKRCEELLAEYPAGVNMLRLYRAKSLVPLQNGPSRWTKECAAVWDEVLKDDFTLSTWQTCITESIRANAPIEVIRSYYTKGIKAVTDYPSVLADAYVNFEREMGDSVLSVVEAQTLRDATHLRAPSVHVAYEERKELAMTENIEEKHDAKDIAPSAPVENDEAKVVNKSSKKRRIEAELERQEDYKKQRSAEKDGRTIFLHHLDKSVTKEDLELVFSPMGALADVRILTKSRENPTSRGMAYVDFEEAESVEKALTLDGVEFKGAPLNIVRADAQVKATKIVEKDGVWTTNPTTLYVAYINKLVTEQHLQDFFKKFGAIKAVMILGRRQNRYGLVEFEDKQSVVDALVSDESIMLCEGQVKIKKARFSVADMVAQQAKAKANNKQEPPKKKQDKKSNTSSPKKSSNKPHEHVSSHPASRISLPPKNAPSETKMEEASTKSSEAPRVDVSKMKNNADFRKLFMQ